MVIFVSAIPPDIMIVANTSSDNSDPLKLVDENCTTSTATKHYSDNVVDHDNWLLFAIAIKKLTTVVDPEGAQGHVSLTPTHKINYTKDQDALIE